ncbi:aminotransferase class I/II-fold pyridoxal phosphate-dependent enzyme [Variovorax sp. OV329]|uniref:aminotransferase class I/II-fold pyridoxal phosphate-dependent enzyme n=1 Tax=Variovorax sp. OV329 TaxID=1882825 RepID=UPI0008E84B1B|nr:aminotransferase class I/II-fold pyridoxal phosphate-dependent enzyme [Variovorax sp. OV329]SFM46331.1 histidinol-phosphate aminotransferase [Variovorax sp. OV329]
MAPPHFAAMHGGPDAAGRAAHDFSTNANACGPCPEALAAVAQADARYYCDPAYTDLRGRLGAFHGVSPSRIHMAASGSEFIMRMTAAVNRLGGLGVHAPVPGYGDYLRSALALGMSLVPANEARLLWHGDPASPTGQTTEAPPLPEGAVGVLDMAYAPLRLSGRPCAAEGYWQLWTPNKALGLTGVRAAYALAPPDADEALLRVLDALMPSWPIGAHGVAMLHAWAEPAVQRWIGECLPVLSEWKSLQLRLCESLGWHCLPSDSNFFCAQPPTDPREQSALLQQLRELHGIQLRDTASMGLPGFVRMAVLPPASQAALGRAISTSTT